MVDPSLCQDLRTDWEWNSDTVVKANGFLSQFRSSTFVIAFNIVLEVFACLRGLTVKWQGKAADVAFAYKEVGETVKRFEKMRENSEEEFSSIFEETTNLGKELYGEMFQLTKLRSAGRQMHRSNMETTNVESYYRISLYNEFLSYIIEELQGRFQTFSAGFRGLFFLLPSECRSQAIMEIPNELENSVSTYVDDLPCAAGFKFEYRNWVRFWKEAEGEIPATLTDSLTACDVTLFPNIKVLLTIAVTIPVTSCESERSFSQLKLIKTAHRSTMTADRLSGLALMKINRERCDQIFKSADDMNGVIHLFFQMHPRRMKMPCLLVDK